MGNPDHTCGVAGCERKRYARGMCNLHWQRDRNGVAMDIPARGGGHTHPDGYLVKARKYEHIRIAEAALGKPLPKGAEVHHVNGDPSDNRPENLVICPDTAYHKLLHRRERALEACGNAGFRKCVWCGGYSDPATMSVQGRGSFRHKQCNSRKAKHAAIR